MDDLQRLLRDPFDSSTPAERSRLDDSVLLALLRVVTSSASCYVADTNFYSRLTSAQGPVSPSGASRAAGKRAVIDADSGLVLEEQEDVQPPAKRARDEPSTAGVGLGLQRALRGAPSSLFQNTWMVVPMHESKVRRAAPAHAGLFLPLHETGCCCHHRVCQNHWTLVVLHLKRHASVYYNSAAAVGSTTTAPCVTIIEFLFAAGWSTPALAAEHGFSLEDTALAEWKANAGDISKFGAPVPDPANTPRQRNTSDCGVFVVATAAACVQGAAVRSHSLTGCVNMKNAPVLLQAACRGCGCHVRHCF